MAISKAFLFSPEEQQAADFGFAFGHPARVVLLRRLKSGAALRYNEMVENMPIVPGTVEQHIRILQRLNFIVPEELGDKKVGFRLNSERYYECGRAARRQMGRATTLRLSERGVIGVVG